MHSICFGSSIRVMSCTLRFLSLWIWRLLSLELEQRMLSITTYAFSNPHWPQTNRVWVFDLARQLLRSVQLYGFDISDAQFPPKALWPQNVSLDVLDSLNEAPASLAGQFDVIHLRMWASNLLGKDPSLLISHVKRLLSMIHYYWHVGFYEYW